MHRGILGELQTPNTPLLVVNSRERASTSTRAVWLLAFFAQASREWEWRSRFIDLKLN